MNKFETVFQGYSAIFSKGPVTEVRICFSDSLKLALLNTFLLFLRVLVVNSTTDYYHHQRLVPLQADGFHWL